MTIRTTKSTVTFTSPFFVKGLPGPQPSGTYEIETDEEVIEGNERTIYRRIATFIFLRTGGTTRTCTVNPRDLEIALAKDAGQAAIDAP